MNLFRSYSWKISLHWVRGRRMRKSRTNNITFIEIFDQLSLTEMPLTAQCLCLLHNILVCVCSCASEMIPYGKQGPIFFLSGREGIQECVLVSCSYKLISLWSLWGGTTKTFHLSLEEIKTCVKKLTKPLNL